MKLLQQLGVIVFDHPVLNEYDDDDDDDDIRVCSVIVI